MVNWFGQQLFSVIMHAEANDVTKQKDLGRFYQHLLDQKTRPTTHGSQQEQQRHLAPLQDSEHKSGPVLEQSACRHQVEGSVDDKVSRFSESPLSNQSDDRQTDQAEQNLEVVDAAEIQDLPAKGQEARKKHDSLRPCPDEESVEKQRKKLFAKRTTDDAQFSAKERYLARKKQKLSQPAIVSDD